MIESGAVGAVFEIQDRASPVLERIAEELEALQAQILKTQESMKALAFPPGLNRSLGLMETRMTKIADASKASADAAAGAAGAFARMDTASAAMSTSLANAAREMKSIAADSKAVNGPAALRRAPASLRARGGGGHGGGVHFGGAGVPLPGDQHARISGGPALVAAGAVAWGAYNEAELQDFVTRMFMTGGITPTGPLADDPRYRQIRDSILKSYARTGRPLEQIEEGFLEGTRLLAPLPFDQRVAAISAMLPNATLESYLKEGTSVPDAVKAMVGLTHMQGKYGADQIAAMSNHLAYLSTTTDASLEQTTRAASYAVPILRIADFDPGQLLSMITSMQRAGIMNTKSGTWLDNMFERSFPGTSLMSERLFKAHEAALQKLHLIDKDNKQTFLDDKGKPDAFKFMDILGKAIEGMPKGDMIAVMKSLFGTQGEKAAAFFSDATNQKMIQQSREDEKNFKTGEAAWKDANENSPIVQFRTSFAGLNVELMNLGSNVLPYVTSMLKQANETLGGKGELAAGGLGLLGWMTKGWWGNAAKSLVSGAIGLGGGVPALVLGAAGVGVYAASELSTPSAARGIMAQPDPGYAERKRISDVLNPPSPPPQPPEDSSSTGRVAAGSIVGNLARAASSRKPLIYLRNSWHGYCFAGARDT